MQSKEQQQENIHNEEQEQVTPLAAAEPEAVEHQSEEPVQEEVASSEKEENAGQQEDLQEKEIEKLKSELAELQDKYLRLYSEFENFRRRTNKEKLELIEYASERIILELLPVMDDFDRAQQVMKDSSEQEQVNNGIQLIIGKLRKILADQGLEEIQCLEKEFDPDLHEAITKIPAPNKKLKGKIVDQVQKGYMLKGKVIRHSKVVVGE